MVLMLPEVAELATNAFVRIRRDSNLMALFGIAIVIRESRAGHLPRANVGGVKIVWDKLIRDWSGAGLREMQIGVVACISGVVQVQLVIPVGIIRIIL